ncbi:pentapeptide repeat-containing protein [Flagellimonas sp.]|uniref:pentapeptide repeat-containing protein n=1 Tax=Flagellimonas sp. TaxID=2058762 RepID=UPI003AB7A2CF
MDAFELQRKLSTPSSKQHFLKIENTFIDISNGLLLNDLDIDDEINVIQFINCEFSGPELLFEKINNPKLEIFFRSCKFDCRLYFTGLAIKGLKFIQTIKLGDLLDIRSSKLEDLYFTGNKGINPEITGFMDISHNHINKAISFEFLNHVGGEFLFENNRINNFSASQEIQYLTNFSDAKLHNASFSNSSFDQDVKFDRMKLSYDKFGSARSFTECQFQSAYFNEVDFGERCFFNGSIFNKNALFIFCGNGLETLADFSGCRFFKDVYFNSTQFKSLTSKNSYFFGMCSFEETKFKEIEFERNIFEKAAFFDGIEISELDSCSRKTLRTIKQELQRTENRIDYNIFKAAELNAYKKELKKNQWEEAFILWLNNLSSKHGLNWLRSSIFTLTIAMLSYIAYFITENYSSEVSLNIDSINYFLIGYFKFLIPTYNPPFQNGLSLWFQYLPYIIGKIFITYGIYQTIQAFRKFRL